MELKNIITLKNVRISFMQSLWTAQTVNGEGQPAHSCHFLISADDPQVKAINALIDKVAQEQWASLDKVSKKPVWQTLLPTLRAQDKVCLHAGDTKAQYEGYAGNYFLSARNQSRVLVLDRDKTPLEETDGRPYSGCYVDGNVQIWAQDNKWGKRVNATLRWVQFRRDGDAFAGAAPARDDEVPDISAEEDDGADGVGV